MNCIIDVGGGNKGAFGAGVVERCLDDHIVFDNCIGVSAGGANLITYAAQQGGRLYHFYHDYAFRKEYMSFSNVLKQGHYIDLDYVFSTLTNSDGESPLDFQKALQYPGKVEITITDAASGQAEFVPISEMKQDDYWCLKASCVIPFVCKPVERNGHVYYDGGIGDPVPIRRAVEMGCDKIVLVLTRPKDFRKTPGMDAKSATFLEKQYPRLAELLRKRAENYNVEVDYALELEKQGKCCIIAPPELSEVGTLKKSPDAIDQMFRCGYREAEKIKAYLEADTNSVPQV